MKDKTKGKTLGVIYASIVLLLLFLVVGGPKLMSSIDTLGSKHHNTEELKTYIGEGTRIDGAELIVYMVSEQTLIEGYSTSEGERFLIVDIKLTNHSVEQLPYNPHSAFRIESSDGVSKSPHFLSYHLPNAFEAGVLEPNEEVEGSLVFVVGIEEVVDLVYAPIEGLRLDITLQSRP